MKILVASHTYIVDLNCEKLRHLAQLEPGIEVVVVVPRRWQPGGVQHQTIETQPWQEGSFRVVPVANGHQRHQGLLWFGWDLVSLLKQFRPQIIQVEQGAKAIAYAQFITLNRLLGLNAKNCFFTWWNLPYSLRFPVSALERYNLSHTNGAIAGNQDSAAILRQRGYSGLIQVMPQLGIDEQRFCPQLQPQLADRLGITSADVVVGFVGRFVAEKGLLTLLHALVGLPSELPWKWLLVGRGELRSTLEQQANHLGVSDRLLWVESVPHADIPHYLNLMNMLVLPSQTTHQFKTLTATGWAEQFGHVLIEAMACQVPVIGSDSGEIPHVIGDAGLVFPQGDANGLRDRILQIATQPALAAALAQKGYQRVLMHYTNRALAQQQLEFYHQLLAQSPS